MQTVQIVNVAKGVVLAQKAQIASSLGQRLKGLLGKKSLTNNEGLVLKPCASIHTFFMRFPIDVLFLDKNMRIIKLIQNMPPARLSSTAWGSKITIELPAGKISQTNTQTGDILQFSPV